MDVNISVLHCICYKLTPLDNHCSRAKDQLINKLGVPIRPTVSYCGSLLYNLNKCIDSIMKSCVNDENNHVKNSTTLSNYIRNISTEDDETIVLFYVTSLYTNIPIIVMLNIIKDYVNNDDQLNRKTAVPQDKFRDLVNLVLTNSWYTFSSQF